MCVKANNNKQRTESVSVKHFFSGHEKSYFYFLCMNNLTDENKNNFVLKLLKLGLRMTRIDKMKTETVTRLTFNP